MQALRWRITRTRGANLRREIIISYSKHDILDMKRNSPCVLDRITNHPLKRVSEFAARFVNALASDYSGRSYLLESDKLVLMFIQILKQEKGDSIVRRNSLGALQKLSLRKRPQLIMIEQDMIKWIINTLKHEKETLGEYSYEYATALFMNLSLRSLGKKKCEDPNVNS
jgi:LisH domain-containing protein ARMC9